MFSAALFALAWYRHATFHSTTLDLAVFDQAVWKMSRFQAPEVSVLGWNVFADHISLVLVMFVPLYWLAATPLWLLLAQAAACGIGYLTLRPLLREAGAEGAVRGWLAAYLLSAFVWNASLYDFHPSTLAVPILLVGIHAALRDDRRVLLGAALLLLFLRDDLGAAVSAVALIGWSGLDASGRRFRLLLGLAGIAASVAGSAIGAALGSDRRWEARYGYIADTPWEALATPWTSLVRLTGGLWDGSNLRLLIVYLASVGFIAILAPRRLLIVLVLALPLFASATPELRSYAYHHGAVLSPFLLAAAAQGSTRLPERFAQRHLALWVGMLAAVTLLLIGPHRTSTLVEDSTDSPSAARSVLAAIEPEERVVADAFLGPHVAHRETLLLFPVPFGSCMTEGHSGQFDALVIIAGENARGRARRNFVESSPCYEGFEVDEHSADVLLYRRRPTGAASLSMGS